MLCSAKVSANAESSVGLLTLAGRSARILVTSTRDLSRVFTCMHDVKFDGESDFVAGIKKAQLALKHRQNHLQRQRIVVFVCSPLDADTEALVRLGKKLKKNSVAVDVVDVGLESDNAGKIDAFIEAVNSNENSRAIHVASGGPNLADALMNSDIYMERDASAPAGEGGTAGGEGGGDTSEFPFGVDPSQDPELAMALQISMQEERARQEAARQTEASAGGEAGAEAPKETETKDGAGAGAGAGAGPSSGKYEDNDDDLYGTGAAMDVDDEEQLRRAIELSRQEADASSSAQDQKDDGTKKE